MESQCLNAITVYGASSQRIATIFTDAAFALGAEIARAGRPLVCGGGRTGVMGAAIDGALSAGGEAIGVLPRFMVDRGWNHPGLTRLIAMPDMHRRKQTMATLASGVIACPGGVGTFEELMEIITWRKLGLWSGNIVILNVDRYYDPIIAMLSSAIRLDFMKEEDSSLWAIASTPAEAVRLACAPFEKATDIRPKQ